MAPEYDKDHILLKNISFFAHHGVYEKETKEGQNFILSAKLFCDMKKAGESDDLADTVDYSAVASFMVRFLSEHTFKLLECAARKVMEAVLTSFPQIDAMEVRLEKPEAPMGLSFETVAVVESLGWHKAYLGLGSNMGDKKDYLDMATQSVSKCPLCRNVRRSSLIETKPYGGVEQDDFLNGALELETLFSPAQLLDFCHEIEEKAHRKREVVWGPRTLDLDILFYDDLVLDTRDLTIPHADLVNRSFVLEPLCELAPYLRHPLAGKTVKQLLAELS